METRDKEIERLNRLLDGGRPVDAVLREGKKDSSERVVAHLNVQVIQCLGICSIKNFTIILMMPVMLNNSTSFVELLFLVEYIFCKHQP